ncbi:hypothetical protein ACFL0Q_05720, partial [Thermodesulfobacteriota bacterium]
LPTGTFTLQDAPSFPWRANAELSCAVWMPKMLIYEKVKVIQKNVQKPEIQGVDSNDLFGFYFNS